MRAAWLALLILAGGCKEASMEYAAWRPAGGGYSLEIPTTWELRDRSKRTVPGLVLLQASRSTEQGRPVLEEPASLIRVSYYAEGNRFYSGPEELVREAAPGAKAEKSRVAGLPALIFRTRFQEPFPPEAAEPAMVDTVRQHVVVAGEDGFWDFQLTAPESRYGRVNAVFRRLVESFRVE